MSPNQVDFDTLAALADPEPAHAAWLHYIMARAAGRVPAGSFNPEVAA